MNNLKEYNIKLTDLEENKSYFYDYAVGMNFFTFFEEKEIKDGKISAQIIVIKNSNNLIFEIIVKGNVILVCDRCLDEYEQPVDFKDTVFAKELDDPQNDNSDIIYLGKKTTEINIAKFIYDTILLALPIKHNHLEDENGNFSCNPLVMEKIKKYIIN